MLVQFWVCSFHHLLFCDLANDRADSDTPVSIWVFGWFAFLEDCNAMILLTL